MIDDLYSGGIATPGNLTVQDSKGNEDQKYDGERVKTFHVIQYNTRDWTRQDIVSQRVGETSMYTGMNT